MQLRQDNAAGAIYNLVGFQTHLKFPEQRRVFSMIPALHEAQFVRYGVMHRNTFLNSPRLLDDTYADRREPLIAFAGQMTGVEGYVESCASGVSCGRVDGGAAERRACSGFHKPDGDRRARKIHQRSLRDRIPADERQLWHHRAAGAARQGEEQQNLAIAERALAQLEAMRNEGLA